MAKSNGTGNSLKADNVLLHAIIPNYHLLGVNLMNQAAVMFVYNHIHHDFTRLNMKGIPG